MPFSLYKSSSVKGTLSISAFFSDYGLLFFFLVILHSLERFERTSNGFRAAQGVACWVTSSFYLVHFACLRFLSGSLLFVRFFPCFRISNAKLLSLWTLRSICRCSSCPKARSSYWPGPTVKKEAKRPLEKGFRFRVCFRFFRPLI